MALAAETIIDDKYVLERLLGEGGMGSVWQSRHRILGAPVAIKFLRSDRTHHPLTHARFVREAKAAAKLRTRHVVKVHDYGVDGHHAYIVMELLEGEDLGVRLRRFGLLPPDQALRIITHAARGLHHAHAAKIVHRDLKPANIFLTVADGEELVKILDFGIAKFVDETPSNEESTKTGVLLGSPHYMSPEHIRGLWKQLDHRSDLWSLAVIAFRALTSKMPFPGELVSDVMLNVCHRPPPDASRLVAGLPSSIDGFFERALARNPDERFQSAEELAQAFAIALGRAPSLEPWSLPDETPAPAARAPSTPPASASTDAPTVTWQGGETRSVEEPVVEEPVAPPPVSASSAETVVASPGQLESARRWSAQDSTPPGPLRAAANGNTEQGLVRSPTPPAAARPATIAAGAAVVALLAIVGWGLGRLSADESGPEVERWMPNSPLLAWGADLAESRAAGEPDEDTKTEEEVRREDPEGGEGPSRAAKPPTPRPHGAKPPLPDRPGGDETSFEDRFGYR